VIHRITCGLVAALIGMAGLPATVAPATAPPPPKSGESLTVRGSRDALRDAWLASDAAVFGTYHGVDSTLGSRYHVLEVADVWMGTPSRGRLVFKAPRGIRLRAGQDGLVLLWDRLAGATDAYLQEMQERHGDGLWAVAGPDSITPYLLPFGAYSYGFDGERLRLRGTSPFPTEIQRSELEQEMLDFESELLPENLYRSAETVLRAKVQAARLQPRREGDVLIELRVAATFDVEEIYKGAGLDTLRLEFASRPRAPRFRADEVVVLFLARGEGGLRLAQGKRAVFHVVEGEVLEAGQPLAAFVKRMRGN